MAQKSASILKSCCCLLCLCDSQSVMHYAVKDYDGELEPRISTRTTVAGDLPCGVDGRRTFAYQDSEWEWDVLQRDAVMRPRDVHEDVLNTAGGAPRSRL